MATFKEAFAQALAEKGTGKVFTWNGKQYKTDLASGKTQKPKVNPQVVDMAGKGNDKSLAPANKVKPKARPSLAPKTSPKPQTRTSAAMNTSNQPKVDSTGPAQPKAVKDTGPMKIVRGMSATGTASANAGAKRSAGATAKPTMEARNVGALKKGAASFLSGAKELMTKGSVSGSAYDARQAAKKQRTKDIEKALFDQRMQRAEDEEMSASKRTRKGK
jgi:hypothetical protein